MSYILDALRRSDQDRKKGDVPDLQSQPDVLVRQSSIPLRADRKNGLVWFLPILVALFLWWIWPISTSKDKTGASVSESEVRPDGLQQANEDPVVRPETAQQQQLSGDSLHLDALKDVQLDISPVVESAPTVPQARISAPPEEPPADTPAAMTRQREVVAEPPQDSAQSNPQLSESIPSTDSPDLNPGPYDGIPHQRQLRYDLQDALPDLNISVHLYSTVPSSRLVRINNTIYREGDFIDTELKLEEITRDGLIMSIRNERFWQHAR